MAAEPGSLKTDEVRRSPFGGAGSISLCKDTNRDFNNKVMSTDKQKAAARKNIKKAATAAEQKRTIAHLPKKIRTALGKKGAAAARK